MVSVCSVLPATGVRETAYAVWRQVESGVLDLSALDVTTAGLDDPDAVLAQAEATNGLGIVALLP